MAISENNVNNQFLIDLARKYLEIVDNGTPEQQDAERTRLHNMLIVAMMKRSLIDQPNRVQARWLARYLVETDYLNRESAPKREFVMFLRKGNGTVPRLEPVPPFAEHEEKDALKFYIPVKVTIEPLIVKEASDNGHNND